MLVLALGVALACETPEPSDQQASHSAPEWSDSDPVVGYDLRRLRPPPETTLAALFERVHAQAVADHKRVVVLFSASWCEPCRHIELELGNTHPSSMIGDVRVLVLEEDEWTAVARMDEFNSLRRRWEPVLNTYPLMILIDEQGQRVEEMKDAKARLENAGLEPTLPTWFADTRPVASS